MPKGHCDHRIVLRDAASGRIIEDVPFSSFAMAKPEYDRRLRDGLEPGQELAIQHGARIIFKAEGR